MHTVAVVPAYRNESTIAETAGALLAQEGISGVVVVDDASDDATAERAAAAGARVVRLPRNRGKGAALEAGLEEAGAAEAILLVDGDTGASAVAALELLGPIARGEADMVIGVLPAPGGPGGFGLVRRAAGWLIRATSGYRPQAPLSGQRAIRREALEACRPLAEGFGVDAALTADAARRGFRILEQAVGIVHVPRGRTLGGFAHRARQGWDVLKAFAPRLFSRGRALHPAHRPAPVDEQGDHRPDDRADQTARPEGQRAMKDQARQ